MQTPPAYDITQDDLGRFGRGPALVTFGEVMERDTPADMERPEQTRLVHLSMAGSEYTLRLFYRLFKNVQMQGPRWFDRLTMTGKQPCPEPAEGKGEGNAADGCFSTAR
jgi:hypothetical protein